MLTRLVSNLTARRAAEQFYCFGHKTKLYNPDCPPLTQTAQMVLEKLSRTVSCGQYIPVSWEQLSLD
ncbi:MAG: hypothetical protein NT099_06095, partial [Candidatus Saganbacteria bacterium]|nr:hypothetical protein [Candidatus Saganbacteria bacterium]